MGIFTDKIARFSPSWFQDRWMLALLRSVGGVFDDFTLRLYDGLRNGNPYAGPDQPVAPLVVGAGHGTDNVILLTLDTTRVLRGVRELHLHSAETTGGLVMNGTWPIRIVDATHVELVGSTWTGDYVRGAVCSFLGLRQCDPDVLSWHARDRGIRIYDTEPELSKRYRLSRWRQLKKRRGSHRGELENVQPFWLSTPSAVLPTVRIVFQDNRGTPSAQWHTLTGAGLYSVIQRSTSNWNYDDDPTKRSRFWAIVYLPPGYSTAVTYDDGVTVYDGGAIYDGVTALAIRDLVDAIKEAKAAHSRLAGVIATSLQPDEVIPDIAGTHHPFDPTDTAQTHADGWTTLPTGNWKYVSDPDTGLPTRPPWATWLYEDNQ